MAYQWQAQQLGEYLRNARTERGLSLRALAATADVDFGWLGKLERGEFDAPDPRHLSRIAWALGLNIADIYMEAGYPAVPALPSVRPYLRAKYDMPDDAAALIERHINEVIAQVRRRKEGDDESEI